MLSKDVCKSCATVGRRQGGDLDWGWDRSDDMAWGRGYINCPVQVAGLTFGSVSDEPPEYCPHKFEHAVSKGMYDHVE